MLYSQRWTYLVDPSEFSPKLGSTAKVGLTRCLSSSWMACRRSSGIAYSHVARALLPAASTLLPTPVPRGRNKSRLTMQTQRAAFVPQRKIADRAAGDHDLHATILLTVRGGGAGSARMAVPRAARGNDASAESLPHQRLAHLRALGRNRFALSATEVGKPWRREWGS
jgi:hypothetical protein